MAKTWLITGCSSGLGHGIAEAVLRRGDRAAVTSRNPDDLRDFLEKYPEQVILLRLDLNDRSSMGQAVKETLDRFGKIDVPVNNAGHGYRAAIEESDPVQVAELFETDFFAPMELIRLVLPQMRERKSGQIINISSIGAVRGAMGNGYYSAAKGALELASEALAKEVEHLGIRVMLIEPGAFRTGFYDHRLQESRQKLADYDILAEKYRKEYIRNSHNQQGNPEKGGELIVETAMSEAPPFRLLLGSDAVKAAQGELEERLREIHIWKNVSCQSDYQIWEDSRLYRR